MPFFGVIMQNFDTSKDGDENKLYESEIKRMISYHREMVKLHKEKIKKLIELQKKQ